MTTICGKISRNQTAAKIMRTSGQTSLNKQMASKTKLETNWLTKSENVVTKRGKDVD